MANASVWDLNLRLQIELFLFLLYSFFLHSSRIDGPIQAIQIVSNVIPFYYISSFSEHVKSRQHRIIINSAITLSLSAKYLMDRVELVSHTKITNENKAQNSNTNKQTKNKLF